jgi:hypothetical protein
MLQSDNFLGGRWSGEIALLNATALEGVALPISTAVAVDEGAGRSGGGGGDDEGDSEEPMLAKDVGWLAKYIRKDDRLRRLNLSNNRINTEGVTILAKALRSNHTILGLRFDGNEGVLDAKGFLHPFGEEGSDGPPPHSVHEWMVQVLTTANANSKPKPVLVDQDAEGEEGVQAAAAPTVPTGPGETKDGVAYSIVLEAHQSYRVGAGLAAKSNQVCH